MSLFRKLPALMIGFLVGAAALLPMNAGAISAPQSATVAGYLPDRPCNASRVTNCFWDAGRHGGGWSYWTDSRGGVHFLDPRHNSDSARLAWQREMRSDGWHRLGTVDGHNHCYVKFGDTSRVKCWDGYTTTS